MTFPEWALSTAGTAVFLFGFKWLQDWIQAKRKEGHEVQMSAIVKTNQNQMEENRQKADWNRKRKEAYAKFIGAYFDYLRAIHHHRFIERDKVNRLASAQPRYHDEDTSEKVSEIRDVFREKTDANQQEQLMNQARVFEAHALVYIYETDEDTLKEFETTFGSSFEKVTDVHQFDNLKHAQFLKAKEFARKLNDGKP